MTAFPLSRSTLMRLTLLASVLAVAAAASAADRPNVLFVAVDDMRPDLGCYGTDFIKTPNLDRLAAGGLVFDRAYCQQAVCSPSRTSLMTGRRPDTTRVYDLVTHFRDTIPDVVTLPQQFKANGYHAVGMGKIYHGGYDDSASWSEPHLEPKGVVGWALPENQAIQRKRAAAAKAKGLKGQAANRQSRGPATESADVPDETYHDGALAALAVETLGRLAKADEPFFLAVGFHKPHLPFIAPKKYWDFYDRSAFGLPENDFRPNDAPPYAIADFGELRAYSDIPSKGPVGDDKALELIHGYYAALSYTDAQVGKLLDALDALDLADDTIVVVWGDHGWKLGEHAAWCKHSNVELDVRVPLILRVPGRTNGQHTPALVEFADIFPSLCDLAGIPKPAGLEGTSFAPLVADPTRPWKAAAFSQYPRTHEGRRLMGYSLTDGRYRLTRWVDRKTPTEVVAAELYDHHYDPAENENVAADPRNADAVKRLTALAERGWRGVRDDLKE